MEFNKSIFLNLYFSCKNLKDKDVFSKSDPMIELYMNDALVGRTEIIKNNLDPSFNTPVKIQYYFEKRQNLTIKVIDIDDEKKFTGDSIGQVTTTLGDIVSQEPETPYTRSIENGGGTMTIMFEEIIPDTRKILTAQYVASGSGLVTQEMKKGSTYTKVMEKFIIQAKGIKLTKMDLFGKSDPYYSIHRIVGPKKVKVYQSEVIKKTLNPEWKAAIISKENLDENCLAEGQRYSVEVYDHDKLGSDDYIGEVEFENLFYNITPDGQEFRGILVDKSGKGKQKENRGEIVLTVTYDIKSVQETVSSYQVISNYNFATNLTTYPNLLSPISFIDAMRMGMNLHIMCAVDYTSSNRTMHDVKANEMNPYQTALSAVGQVLEPYDHDRKFSFYGYGAKKNGVFPPYFTVGETEEVEGGVQGILDTYARTRDQIELGDMGTAKGGDMDWRANKGRYYCDDFYQIINAVADKAEADMIRKFPPNSHRLPSDYYILFFVIDGDGFDPNEMNPYQTALSAVGQVLEPYDHDRKFSFYGYGAKKNGVFPPYFTVGETEEVEGGVQGILDTYARTRDQIELGDMGTAKGGDMDWRANKGRYYCDDFYQIINAVADKAEADMMGKFPPNSHRLPSDYYILFFVIDGDGFDRDGTVRALIRASALPMSIVLIGVGGSDFTNLSKFDADDRPLSVDGVSTIRDIVQFVKFNECKDNGEINMTKLASEVLAEVPTQVETFIGLYGCTLPTNVGMGYPPLQPY
ncbi:hypothetical protein PIROE2DRAFT_69142 [Piromyces sp. E2]|nr:hypothetical protein PIROE2DRAFT_69142 [Piromyces sp. E2]|eukprot:OUM65087.1 hypothetical protein PIROE2DRAFT_69142 [Piromyces sp. E2]